MQPVAAVWYLELAAMVFGAAESSVVLRAVVLRAAASDGGVWNGEACVWFSSAGPSSSEAFAPRGIADTFFDSGI